MGQDLALCNLKLALAEREKDLLKANAIRNEVSELIHNTAEKVRSLCFELSSSTLYRIGFKEALVELCNSMSKRYDVHFKVEGNYLVQKLDATIATVLFKATRELLFNEVKHAGIEEATVFITGNDNMLNLTVEDRGSGFSHFDDGNLIDVGTGVGLFGIRERLRDLGGELHIESIPGDKTRVMIMVPTGMFRKQCCIEEKHDQK